MTRRAAFLLAIVLIVGAGDGFPTAFGPGVSGAQTPLPRVAPGFFDPAQRAGRAYKNVDPEYRRASYWARLHSLVVGATWLVSERRVAALPLATPDLRALREKSRGATVTWIGHSTVLAQLDGVTFVTDPTWAGRSGPFSGFVGVRRYTPPGIAFDELPPIDFVLISHDHYDGRTAIDQGRRLWSSWAVLGSKRFYFGGDTGYYRHFKETGDRRGPFDLAALPIGSYTPREIAKPVHTSPEEALQAALDLRATHLLGVHWGTFELAREPYDEPPTRMRAELERRRLDPATAWILKPGETRTW